MVSRLGRIGLNESHFRARNEEAHDCCEAPEQVRMFICECGEMDCKAPMEMTCREYDKVRGYGARFAVIDRSHVIEDAENIVEEFDHYVVVEKHSEGKKVAEAHDPRHHVKTCRVVVVDDVVEVRTLLKMMLQVEPSCTVVAEAGNGREAIDAVAATEPDVVVLDLEMPEMDGREALPEIVKIAPDVKVIVFSSAHGIDERELVRLGAFDFVAKGSNLAVIINAIEEAALSDARHAKHLSGETSE